MPTYNGWRNHATWNVALWIQNDEPLYRLACDYTKAQLSRPVANVQWWRFVQSAGLAEARTPDGYAYRGRHLDSRALSRMLRDMVE